MSNWQFPQWIMLTIILFEFVGGCIRLTKTEAEMIKKAKEQKQLAEFYLVIHTLLNIFEVWILAKGGFW